MAERERIIPIQIEGGRDRKRASSEEQEKLSESLKGLTVKSKKLSYSTVAGSSGARSKPATPKVQVKPAPLNVEDEYLKSYDVLEKRSAPEVTLPNFNVIERIVLVIDRAQDENYTPFTIGNQEYPPLSMVKRAVTILVKLKLSINPLHQFAIILMNENTSTLVLEFTSEAKKILDCINQITPCETEDIFNLNSVFDIIEEVPLPEPYGDGLPPPCVIRTILFYGRSYTLPEIKMSNRAQRLLDHPFLICDVMMTHEPVEAANNCQKIFDKLQGLDQKGYAYFFPVGRDLRRMHRCAAKLLAHPLQRPIQKLIKN
ncbi:BRISC and BRCA1-A complex member 1-like [Anthonomus grandis grandis]|uniref:BRISC and BRCA1-A complex member 1-like n=1 Tax=Anthonomus grandis grandis TaxID=2921223 RepID=UPI0021668A2F|nr:BRISC and BRCA1-A complex member 1-like [Anthonomus grandis grandis]